MINATNLKNIERKIKDFNQNLTLFEQQFVIIPYLASGYIDYSNFGQVDGQRIIDNYETYKRLWTGNDSFNITWKDSVKFTNTQQDTAIKMDYQIGDAILGWLEQNSSVVNIENDVSFSEYKAQTIDKVLSFRVNALKFNLDTNWEFMFFKVPELSNNILYRVDSIEREYMGKDLLCYVLNLKALNQDLANTGRAKQQNVMPNSPGQGYWDAKIVDNYIPEPTDVEGVDYKKFFDRYIIPDKSKMFNNPVKKVVVKAFGLCALSNIAFWGRKVRAGRDYRNFGIPRWIFPINFTNATTYTLYRTQTAEVNYYWINNLAPKILFNKEVFEALKSQFAFDAIWPSQGFLEMVDTYDVVKQTNPTTAGSPYPYQLFGENTVSAGVAGYNPWTITISGKNDVRTDMIRGCAQKYSCNGSKVIHQAMFDAFWTQKKMVALPITPQSTLNFGWSLGSAFAAGVAQNFYSAFALIFIGISATIIQKISAPTFTGFACMVPAAMTDFMIEECKGSFVNLANHIKTSYFLNKEIGDIETIFNTETMNTSFQAELTDWIKGPTNKTDQAISTVCIGQKTYDDGTNILKDGTSVLMDGTYTLEPERNPDDGYIIDAIHIQSMFMGDFSIEFLDKQDTVIWSGVFQSQGKWTKSIREINTWINTSIYGRENMFLDTPLPWPKSPAELDLIDITEWKEINIFGDWGVSKSFDTNQKMIDMLKDPNQLATIDGYFPYNYEYESKVGAYPISGKSKILLNDTYTESAFMFTQKYQQIWLYANLRINDQTQRLETIKITPTIDWGSWTEGWLPAGPATYKIAELGNSTLPGTGQIYWKPIWLQLNTSFEARTRVLVEGTNLYLEVEYRIVKGSNFRWQPWAYKAFETQPTPVHKDEWTNIQASQYVRDYRLDFYFYIDEIFVLPF